MSDKTDDITLPALPAAPEWDEKLPTVLQRSLNALRLELPPAIVDDHEHHVRSVFRAMHTSLSTSQRMFKALQAKVSVDEGGTAVLADRAAQAVAVPAGMVLVPLEPNEGMCEAEHRAWMKSTRDALEDDPGPEKDGPRSNIAAAYRAMVAAATAKDKPVIRCPHRLNNGGVCPHHNLQCGWPACNEELR